MAMHACTMCWSKSESHIMQLHVMQRLLTFSWSCSRERGLMVFLDVVLKLHPDSALLSSFGLPALKVSYVPVDPRRVYEPLCVLPLLLVQLCLCGLLHSNSPSFLKTPMATDNALEASCVAALTLSALQAQVSTSETKSEKPLQAHLRGFSCFRVCGAWPARTCSTRHGTTTSSRVRAAQGIDAGGGKHRRRENVALPDALGGEHFGINIVCKRRHRAVQLVCRL